jgi:hypothetical protein
MKSFLIAALLPFFATSLLVAPAAAGSPGLMEREALAKRSLVGEDNNGVRGPRFGRNPIEFIRGPCY